MEINKKIVIDITVLNDGQMTGVPRVIAELSKRMAKDFYDNLIFISFDYSLKRMMVVNKDKFIKYITHFKRRDSNFVTRKQFDFNIINKDSIFYDIAPIEIAYKRSLLYSDIKNRGGKIVTLIHDVIPLTLATFEQRENNIFHFINMFSAIFRYTDLILATTKSEASNIKCYLDKCKCNIPIELIPLGCDLKENYDEKVVSNKIKDITKNPYLLMVGTICPRKNHKLVLQSFIDELHKYNINLIIAGHAGWKCDETMNMIMNSEYYNKRIHFVNNPSNDEIIYLYKNAYASVMASIAEGYGLPVVESLYYKCPLFCADIPVFHEISKEKGVFFNNQSKEEFSNIIIKYLKNKDLYNQTKDNLSTFEFYSWDSTYKNLKDILTKYF